ncbi:uncharacterized protein [Parasteatoda tepidariorum]|uniref:uncharacterized protein n=1 Tax=Parasteatoda tepidariorum TaxID=114398 RepID=UPI00077FD3AC|nr:flocculation protein FLO11 [Parasteatoda tepidariorum]
MSFLWIWLVMLGFMAGEGNYQTFSSSSFQNFVKAYLKTSYFDAETRSAKEVKINKRSISNPENNLTLKEEDTSLKITRKIQNSKILPTAQSTLKITSKSTTKKIIPPSSRDINIDSGSKQLIKRSIAELNITSKTKSTLDDTIQESTTKQSTTETTIEDTTQESETEQTTTDTTLEDTTQESTTEQSTTLEDSTQEFTTVQTTTESTFEDTTQKSATSMKPKPDKTKKNVNAIKISTPASTTIDNAKKFLSEQVQLKSTTAKITKKRTIAASLTKLSSTKPSLKKKKVHLKLLQSAESSTKKSLTDTPFVSSSLETHKTIGDNDTSLATTKEWQKYFTQPQNKPSKSSSPAYSPTETSLVKKDEITNNSSTSSQVSIDSSTETPKKSKNDISQDYNHPNDTTSETPCNVTSIDINIDVDIKIGSQTTSIVYLLSNVTASDSFSNASDSFQNVSDSFSTALPSIENLKSRKAVAAILLIALILISAACALLLLISPSKNDWRKGDRVELISPRGRSAYRYYDTSLYTGL